MTAPHTVYLADHSVLLAIPALLPVAVIVAVILTIVIRDRRAEAREKALEDAMAHESIDPADGGSSPIPPDTRGDS